MARRGRKQHVALRSRRRQELQQRFRKYLGRSVVMALLAGFALGAISHGGPFFGDFVRRHTPAVELRAPQSMAGQPLTLNWPRQRVWLWIPGATWYAGRLLERGCPAIRAVRFEKDFGANRIVARVEARTPLVRWNATGLDREGKAFPILPGTWNQLPVANLDPSLVGTQTGRWLASLAAHEAFWSQVSSISDDRRGSLLLDLKTGARIQWGAPEPQLLTDKLSMLSQVLDDAHAHLGGAALADLRFFDQGRIIVRPKGVRTGE